MAPGRAAEATESFGLCDILPIPSAGDAERKTNGSTKRTASRRSGHGGPGVWLGSIETGQVEQRESGSFLQEDSTI